MLQLQWSKNKSGNEIDCVGCLELLMLGSDRFQNYEL